MHPRSPEVLSCVDFINSQPLPALRLNYSAESEGWFASHPDTLLNMGCAGIWQPSSIIHVAKKLGWQPAGQGGEA